MQIQTQVCVRNVYGRSDQYYYPFLQLGFSIGKTTDVQSSVREVAKRGSYAHEPCHRASCDQLRHTWACSTIHWMRWYGPILETSFTTRHHPCWVLKCVAWRLIYPVHTNVSMMYARMTSWYPCCRSVAQDIMQLTNNKKYMCYHHTMWLASIFKNRCIYMRVHKHNHQTYASYVSYTTSSSPLQLNPHSIHNRF